MFSEKGECQMFNLQTMSSIYEGMSVKVIFFFSTGKMYTKYEVGNLICLFGP